MRGSHSPKFMSVRGRARPIGDVLGKLLQGPVFSQRMRNDTLVQAWREAVGPEVAAHARVAGVRKGVLHVEVDSSTWLHELAGFHKDQILQEMQKRVRTPYIHDLRFRQSGAEPQGRQTGERERKDV